MAKKAALYLRSSKDRHDVSIESQRRELTQYANQQGDIIVAEFVDKVESAKTDDRPGFQSMIVEAKSKDCRFSVLYCYDTSRFARRQYHAQMYKHLLKKQNIELRFMKLPKTDTILDPIVESLMEAFDEFHSQKSKMDGLRGMRENIEQGWRAGGRAILGYCLDKQIVGMRDGIPITKSKLILDAKTYPQIQAYLKGRSKRESRKALIDSLELKVPYTTLVYIEESALTYAGHTVWNRHNEFIDGKYVGGKKFRPRSEWVIKKNTHEALITDEEAESILAQRNESRQSHKRSRKNSYLLSGLLQCTCGANIDGDSGYYRCHDRCGSRSIKQETLEQAVLDLFFLQLLTPESIQELKNEIENEMTRKPTEKHNLIDELKKELRSIEQQINEIVLLVSKVKHQRPLLERLDGLEDERIDIEQKISKETVNHNQQFLKLSDEILEEFIDNYRNNLQTGEPEKKKAILRTIIDHGVFDGESLEIIPSYQQITGG